MICWILLLIKLSCCVCAPTFEVKATQSFYQAEEKQNVTLEWTFPPTADGSLTSLDATCLMISDVKVSVLFELIEGVSKIQHGQFAGRVHCDTDVLKEGRLRLHVSSLKTEDSGHYLCEMMIDDGRGRGECLLNVSGRSVHATVGDNVVLPVHFKTKLSTSDLMVSWKVNDLVVHTYIHGRDYLTDQNENFKGRTSLFADEMAEGNVSLRLENVTEEDKGTYTCTVVRKDDENDYSVSLSVEPRKSRDEWKDGTPSPPNPNPPRGLSAGVIVVCIVVVCIVGLILGVFLYKQRRFSRNTQNNRNQEQPGANQGQPGANQGQPGANQGQPGANQGGGNSLPVIKDQNECEVSSHHPNRRHRSEDGPL